MNAERSLWFGLFRGSCSPQKNTKKYEYDDNDGLKKWNRKELFMVYLGKSHGIIIS